MLHYALQIFNSTWRHLQITHKSEWKFLETTFAALVRYWMNLTTTRRFLATLSWFNLSCSMSSDVVYDCWVDIGRRDSLLPSISPISEWKEHVRKVNNMENFNIVAHKQRSDGRVGWAEREKAFNILDEILVRFKVGINFSKFIFTHWKKGVERSKSSRKST